MIQRLSLEEVQEVARMASQRRAVLHGSGPTVDRLADALGLPPGQVEMFLNEIRDRQAGLLPPDQSARMKKLGIGAAVIGTLAFAVFLVNLFIGINRPVTVSAQPLPQSPAESSSVSDSRFTTGSGGPPIQARTAEAVPGERIDPGFSSGTMSLGHEAIKDTNQTLDNERMRIGNRVAPRNRDDH